MDINSLEVGMLLRRDALWRVERVDREKTSVGVRRIKDYDGRKDGTYESNLGSNSPLISEGRVYACARHGDILCEAYLRGDISWFYA